MDFEEVDVAQVQKFDSVVISSHWRPVARSRMRLRAKLSIVPPVLKIGVALDLSFFASGHPLAGLWLTTASLSWCFLLGAGDASEQCSPPPRAEGEASSDAPVGPDHAKG